MSPSRWSTSSPCQAHSVAIPLGTWPMPVVVVTALRGRERRQSIRPQVRRSPSSTLASSAGVSTSPGHPTTPRFKVSPLRVVLASSPCASIVPVSRTYAALSTGTACIHPTNLLPDRFSCVLGFCRARPTSGSTGARPQHERERLITQLLREHSASKRSLWIRKAYRGLHRVYCASPTRRG